MEPNETMVEEEFDNEEADDALPGEVVEEEVNPEESLESLMGDEEAPAEEKEPEEKGTAPSEPGWIKKRVEKAVNKAVAETEARMNALFEKQMAPIRAKMLEDEAQALVRDRKVADIETARELVRLRAGMPAAQEPAAPTDQPRQPNGQFAPKEDAATSARIDMLKHQANRIKAGGGPDVVAEFRTNEDIKKKVIAGEMDFYDVADYLKQKPSRKKPPSPMRSPNGASGQNPNAIDSMSDEQFERMERKIKEGARYSLK